MNNNNMNGYIHFVSRALRCNDKEDCADGSDEFGCDHRDSDKKVCKSNENLCGDGETYKCVSLAQFCGEF